MSNTNTIFQDFANKSIRPTPVSFDRLGVKVNLLARLLEEYSSALYTQLESVVFGRGGKVPFTVEDFIRYNRTLVKARVDYVNNNRPLVRPSDRVVVPAFLAEVLTNLGIVSALDIGVELYPVCELLEITDVLQLDEFLTISNNLKLFVRDGFEYSEAMPRDRSGSYDFMTMFMIENEVVAPKADAHPVYALLASVLEMKMLTSVYSPRVNYGNRSLFSSLIRQIATLKGIN